MSAHRTLVLNGCTYCGGCGECVAVPLIDDEQMDLRTVACPECAGLGVVAIPSKRVTS